MDRHLKLDIDYDEEGDVFDAMVCKPYFTDNYMIDYNYTLRFDPKTKELVGIIIIRFSELYPEAKTAQQREQVAQILLTYLRQTAHPPAATTPHLPKRAA